MRLPCSIGAFFMCLAGPALAQAAGPGLSWLGTAGGSTGSFFPTCTNLNVAMLPGDAVTVRIWGDFNSPFVLGVAASATQCLPIPGIGNGLVLDLPASIVFGGLLTNMSPCLSCPPAFGFLTFTVPPTLPVGASVSVQAIGVGNGQLSFTVAITATV
jgi:hypothetical protein